MKPRWTLLLILPLSAAPGGRRLLKAGTVMAMASSKTPPSDAAKRTSACGFGWQVEADGTFAHGGSDGNFALVDPARGVLGLVVTRSPGGAIPRDEFRTLVRRSIGARDSWFIAAVVSKA